ncbi:hypothetical protein MUP38_08170 [Candidatus Bathyarchaeota archaeon]|nr:hypothetical protein [Candidatus Bathyarchaeota archaeon]
MIQSQILIIKHRDYPGIVIFFLAIMFGASKMSLGATQDFRIVREKFAPCSKSTQKLQF